MLRVPASSLLTSSSGPAAGVGGSAGIGCLRLRIPRSPAADREDPEQRQGTERGPAHQSSLPASAPGESAKVKMDCPAAIETYCCPFSAKLIGAARTPPPT